MKPSPSVAKELRANAQYGHATQVHNSVVCVLAENPKDYTGPGTNTYIVGDESVWIIDPGPDCAAHIDRVMQAVEGRQVKGIFVTHTHMDHSPAANRLKVICNAKTYGFGVLSPDIIALTDEDVDVDFVPDVALHHGQEIGIGDDKLVALHTPGHFPNHMCYYFAARSILFSGDHVMGWSTTVVVPPLGNLAEYMASLDVLDTCNADIMLPSHGLAVCNPLQRIEEVRKHRKMRHAQIADCLEKGITCPSKIVNKIYINLTPRLIQAAQGSVLAHIELLEDEKESHKTHFIEDRIC